MHFLVAVEKLLDCDRQLRARQLYFLLSENICVKTLKILNILEKTKTRVKLKLEYK